MKFPKFLLVLTLMLFPVSHVASGEEAAQEETLASMFPDGLQDRDGKEVSLDVLDGKIVGVYFSAYWCGPCRKFTPSLVNYRNANKDDFEVVFLSLDRTKEAKLKYMEDAEMDWLTVDYDGDVKTKLSKKWSVRSIPTLVLLKEGKTLTLDGRSLISANTDIAAIKDSRMETEEYNCGRCDKTHTREKLVLGE